MPKVKGSRRQVKNPLGVFVESVPRTLRSPEPLCMASSLPHSKTSGADQIHRAEDASCPLGRASLEAGSLRLELCALKSWG